MNLVCYLSLAAGTAMLAWLIAEARQKPKGVSRRAYILCSCIQSIFFFSRSANLDQYALKAESFFAVFPLLVLGVAAWTTFRTVTDKQNTSSIIMSILYLCVFLLSIINSSDPKTFLYLCVAAGLVATNASFNLTKSVATSKAVALITILVAPYLAAFFGYWLSLTIHKQTTFAISESSLSSLKRLRQDILSVIDQSDTSIVQLSALLVNSESWAERSTPWRLKQQMADMLGAQLSHMPATFVYLADKNSRLLWSSPQSSSIVSAQKLSLLASRMRSLFRRIGSPVSDFESFREGNYPAYVVAKEVYTDGIEGPLTLVLVRPLYWISSENSDSDSVDFLIGANNRILALRTKNKTSLKLNDFVPSRVSLPNSQSIVREGSKQFLLSREPLSVSGWSLGTASEISGMNQADKIGLITTFLICAALLLAFFLSITPRGQLEIEALKKLQSKSPLRKPEDLAGLVLSTLGEKPISGESDGTLARLVTRLQSIVRNRAKDDKTSEPISEISSLVAGSIEALKEELHSKDLTVEMLPTQGNLDDATIFTDKELVEEALSQLVRKAAGIAPTGSSLLTQCKLGTRKDKEAKLSVTITHPVNPEATASIKELYDPSIDSNDCPSARFDYILAMEAIQALAGDLKVEAASGIGARVVLTFPVRISA